MQWILGQCVLFSLTNQYLAEDAHALAEMYLVHLIAVAVVVVAVVDVVVVVVGLNCSNQLCLFAFVVEFAAVVVVVVAVDVAAEWTQIDL